MTLDEQIIAMTTPVVCGSKGGEVTSRGTEFFYEDLPDGQVKAQLNDNVEALRVGLDALNIEARPVWKPMHKQPMYKDCPAYVNGVSESIFKVGMCLLAGPYVTDDDVKYMVEAIKSLIEK